MERGGQRPAWLFSNGLLKKQKQKQEQEQERRTSQAQVEFGGSLRVQCTSASSAAQHSLGKATRVERSRFSRVSDPSSVADLHWNAIDCWWRLAVNSMQLPFRLTTQDVHDCSILSVQVLAGQNHGVHKKQ